MRQEPESRRTAPSGVVSRLHCQGVTSVPGVVTAAMWGLGYHSRSRGVEPRGCGMLAIVMERTSSEVVICGAGIAGVAAAYHLAVRRGGRDARPLGGGPPPPPPPANTAQGDPQPWPGPGD